MPISEETYCRVVWEDPDGHWELHDGYLLEKPPKTWKHDSAANLLAFYLQRQLDLSVYRVHVTGSRLKRTERNFFIPDVAVIPLELAAPIRDRQDRLSTFDRPLPLAAEVWSPSTGRSDVNAKLPEYKRRGDEEIWRIHPDERTLTARHRQPDGTYAETVYRSGPVRPATLPGVEIVLEDLFI